jgi:hypothetical protein
MYSGLSRLGFIVVRVTRGETTFTRMPSRDHSIASCCDSITAAALAAE